MRLRVAFACTWAVALLTLVLAVPVVAYAANVVLQDATTEDFPTVGLDVVLSAELVPPTGNPGFTVLENGVEVRNLSADSAAENRKPIDVLLLMDTSGSMRGKPLTRAKEAATRFLQAMGPSDRVAVVLFSSEPKVVVDFSQDRAALQAGIGSLSAGGDTALYDGLIQSAQMFESDAGRNRYLVVLSDGGDTTSINNVDAVAASITKASAPVYAVALSSPDYDPSTLKMVAEHSGGRLIAAASADSLSEVFLGIAEELRNLYTVTYTSAKPATKDLEVQMNVANGEAEGTLVTAIPNPVYAAGGLPTGPLISPTGGSLAMQLILAALVGLAVGGSVYGLGTMLAPRNRATERLTYYGEYDGTPGTDNAPIAASRSRVLNAVAVVAEKRGFTGMVRTSLERAGLQLRPNEYIYFHVLSTALAGFAVQLIWGRLLLSVLVVVAVVVAPMLYLTIKIRHRLKAFEDQLPDVLSLIAGSLRAGWGIQQAIELVVEEIAEPAASEFRRVQSEARFGLPLEQAMGRMAERLDSEDFRWTVTAIAIQREVGGNLAEVLDVVATSIRLRAELRRHVSALTAESRFSVLVLSILPVLLLGALFAVNPEYASLLTTTTSGVVSLIFGLLLLVIGIVWINRLTKIEV